MKLLVLLLLFFSISAANALPYRVSVYKPSTAYYEFPESYRQQLLSTSNFGPSGIVKDVQFSSVNYVNSITADMLANTDVLMLGFVWGSGWTITASQALLVKNFVSQGGSLILAGDCDNTYANLVAQYYGVEFYNGWANNGSGSYTISNRSIAPELTNGPFGTISSVSWSSNATTRIIQTGTSTMIDSYGMLSVIAPTTTSGAVVFYADGEMALGSQAGSGDYEKLKLNIFSYAAHSSHVSVPEPATFLSLILAGMAAIFLKKQ